MTYQKKCYNFSNWFFNVLDQLELIWPHHDRKCDFRCPPWPQQWLLLFPCQVTYQMKGNDFSIRPFNVLDLEIILPHYDWKCDLRRPPWTPQWLLLIPCHVTYQKKVNDFSIRPFNILDQLKVIWPNHDRKCDLRWPTWPQQWLFRIPCQVTYQMKGNDFSILPFNILDQLKVIWPHHDRKCDFRWPLYHNNDFFVSNVRWHIKRKVMTSVLDLSMFSTYWRSFDQSMSKNETSDDLNDHNKNFFGSLGKLFNIWKVITSVFHRSMF